MPAAPRILVIGYNAFDITVPVSGFPSPDSKTEVPFLKVGGGGPAATAAVALARLGANVQLVTALTDDPGGLTQRAELLAAGVELDGSPVYSGYECAKAVILVNPSTAERTIFWSRGALPQLPAESWNPRWLESADLLYLDGHEPDLSLVAARHARQRGLPVVMDAGSVRQGSQELVPFCTDVISSSVFAPQLTGIEDPVEALVRLRAMGPQRVAMTFGAQGVLALDQRPFVVPAFEVEVCDTTGAGDVFHAGYAFSLASGGDFRDNLKFGAATAALKCCHWGGRGGLPLLEEVHEMIKSGQLLPISSQFHLS